MMTRKHLRSLADALGRVLARHGISAPDAVRIAAEVVAEMRSDAGVVTPHYDRERFTVAVFGAAQAEEMLRSLVASTSSLHR
jgi:hypothetical protein